MVRQDDKSLGFDGTLGLCSILTASTFVLFERKKKNNFYVVKPLLLQSVFSFFAVKHDPKWYKLSDFTFKHRFMSITCINSYDIYTIKDYSNKTLETTAAILS